MRQELYVTKSKRNCSERSCIERRGAGKHIKTCKTHKRLFIRIKYKIIGVIGWRRYVLYGQKYILAPIH